MEGGRKIRRGNDRELRMEEDVRKQITAVR